MSGGSEDVTRYPVERGSRQIAVAPERVEEPT